MKLTQTPKITNKQREILDLLYSHRFLTRIHIQTLLKHKDKKTVNQWLKDLREKDYINWIYDKEDFVNKTKPAIYYLGINAIRYFSTMGFHAGEELRKRYREHERTQMFIDHCLDIADCVISLENARDEKNWPQVWYVYDTEADYRSDSYYHHIAEDEYIQPDLCFGREEYEWGQPEITESYLLEIFDATLPRYRLRNRLKKYVEFADEETGTWAENMYDDPFPIILLVCASTTDLIYAKRRTRGLLADTWEHEDEDRPDIRFTTIDKLREHGVVGEIWEEA